MIVVEQVREIQSYCRMVEPTGQLPMLGLRGRLYSTGSGKWEESGGETSKFGLTTVELLDCFRTLKESGLERICRCSTSTSAPRSPTSARSRRR